MTCTTCSELKKETKFWKERYFKEKKFRKSLSQWILGVFGFSVTVEVDKDSGGIRIEGKESKEYMSQAILPTAENKVTLLMEDHFTPEDFQEDAEELGALTLALECQGQGQGMEESAGGREEKVYMNLVQEQEGEGQQEGLEQIQHQHQQHFLLLKGEDGATIPIQLDCNQDFDESEKTFILQEGNGNQPPVVYRVASAQASASTGQEEVSSGQEQEEGQAQAPENPDTNVKSDISGAEKQSTDQQQQVQEDVQKRKRSAATKTENPSNTLPLKKAKMATKSASDTGAASTDNTASTTNNPLSLIPMSDKQQKIVLEFGLTLREQAELYVHKKAIQAVRRVRETAFVCTECNIGYEFSSLENALTHTRNHFEGKPYKCPECGEAFAIQKVFLKHRRVMHPKKPLQLGSNLKTSKSKNSSNNSNNSNSNANNVQTLQNQSQAQPGVNLNSEIVGTIFLTSSGSGHVILNENHPT